MIRKSNYIHSNSRARDKLNKRVRANNHSSHSTIRPNTTYRSVESDSRSKFNYSAKTSVPLKAAKARPLGRYADKKSAAGKQSIDVLQNAPIIERAFCRSSSEISARSCCHIYTEITDEDREYYIAMAYTPCDVVRECIDCRFFHV